MARLDDKLDRLAALARELPSEAARDEFKKALLGTSNVVIARAAQLVARVGDKGLIPTLIEAFGRLLQMPAASDKSCRAKSAIIEALDDLGYEWYEPFVQGVSYRQMEPVYGGRVDTAADLRANCAIMLARRGCPDIYFVLTDLLVDSEPSPRLAAVTILASAGGETSELLLRMKALISDKDPAVLRKCFAGLLACDSDRSWELVTGCLKSPDPLVAESAAIALGESHDERAFPILREAFEETLDSEFRRVLLLGMVLTRTDQAIDHLLEMVRGDSVSQGILAVEALSINSSDERLCERVHEAVKCRGNAQLLEAYERLFR